MHEPDFPIAPNPDTYEAVPTSPGRSLADSVVRAAVLDWATMGRQPGAFDGTPVEPQEITRREFHWHHDQTGLHIETSVILILADRWPDMPESSSPLWATAPVPGGWLLAVRKPLRG